MTLKLTLDNLDNLDENTAKFYKKSADGKYVLDTDAPATTSTVENVDGLKSALTKERDARKISDTELALFKALGVTPEDFAKIVTGSKTAKAEPGNANEVALAEIRDLKAKFAARESESDAKVAKAEAIARDVLGKNALTTALTKAGFTTTGLEMIPQKFASRVKVSDVNGVSTPEALDDMGIPYLTKEGITPFDALASDLATKYPDLVSAERRGGAGTVPGAGGAGAKNTIPVADFDALTTLEQAQLFAKEEKPEITH